MATKLTLNIDERIIKQGKQYAQKNKISLSKLIADYILYITQKKRVKIKISPLVESLTGVASVPKNFDYKKEIAERTTKKHR